MLRPVFMLLAAKHGLAGALYTMLSGVHIAAHSEKACEILIGEGTGSLWNMHDARV